MRWLPLSGLVCLIIAAPAEAQIKSGQTMQSSGAVTATLSWQGSKFGFVGTDPHLRIDRGGVTALDVDLARQCQLCNGVAAPDEALHVVDLDGDAEPEVLADLYTGGAHCCATTLIWFFDGTRYARRVMSLGDQGYRRKDLDGDGRPELITADDRFAYAFTAFAYSWFPPLVYDWNDHALVDVTRKFPERIRADLAMIRKLLPRARREGDPRGLVAGYVADEFLLGRRQAGLRHLRAALRRGDLRAIPKGDKTWPSGRGYRPALLKFLERTGY
jgi:hypothetical protein